MCSTGLRQDRDEAHMSKPQPPAPDKRPLCPWCGRALRPRMLIDEERVTTQTGHRFDKLPEYWSGEYQGYGAFDTLRCGMKFGNAAHKAGYRVKRT
jgi:hypothetical protein